MGHMGSNKTQKGLNFVLPNGVKDKAISTVEVGMFDESSRAVEINRFLGTHIEELKDLFPARIDVVKTASGSRVSIA